MQEGKQENRYVQTSLMTLRKSFTLLEIKYVSPDSKPCVSLTQWTFAPQNYRTVTGVTMWPIKKRGIHKPEHFNIFFTPESIFFP